MWGNFIWPCCPELVGANLTVDVGCANDKCGKPAAAVPRERIVACMNYNNTMRIKKCECIFSCVLLSGYILLSLPADVASQYDVRGCHKVVWTWQKKLKDMLCFSGNIDYT